MTLYFKTIVWAGTAVSNAFMAGVSWFNSDGNAMLYLSLIGIATLIYLYIVGKEWYNGLK